MDVAERMHILLPINLSPAYLAEAKTSAVWTEIQKNNSKKNE